MTETAIIALYNPTTALIVAGVIIVILILVKLLFGGIKTKWFTLGTQGRCDHCTRADEAIDNFKLRSVYSDFKTSRQHKKMNEASTRLREEWFIASFIRAFNKVGLPADKGATETTEFLQFRAMMVNFEKQQKEVVTNLLIENGLDAVYIKKYVDDYLESKAHNLLSDSIAWFNVHYKEYGIAAVKWEHVKAELEDSKDFFRFTTRNFFLECIIIALEHVIIDEYIAETDIAPSQEELLELFEDRWDDTQKQLYKKYKQE